ncbi:MAG: hypothetical protein ACPG21_06075 [Crocinitomicaceae bacterium]
MNIKEHIGKENSKKNWEQVVDYIGDDPQRFHELMQIFLHGERQMVQRSSQPVGKIGEIHPRLIKPYFADLIGYLESDPIDAVKRNITRIFQFIPLEEAHEGRLFDIALSYLASEKEPIAVKAFSMTVLRRICEKYPELSDEVIHQIEILVEEKQSPGIVGRGRFELEKLRTIKSLCDS